MSFVVVDRLKDRTLTMSPVQSREETVIINVDTILFDIVLWTK